MMRTLNDISPTHTALVKSLSLGNVILYKKLIIGYKDANMISDELIMEFFSYQ